MLCCGWMKTDVFENDWVTILDTNKFACSRDGTDFSHYCLFVWAGKSYSKAGATCTQILLKTEKNISVFKQERIRADGALGPPCRKAHFTSRFSHNST